MICFPAKKREEKERKSLKTKQCCCCCCTVNWAVTQCPPPPPFPSPSAAVAPQGIPAKIFPSRFSPQISKEVPLFCPHTSFSLTLSPFLLFRIFSRRWKSRKNWGEGGKKNGVFYLRGNKRERDSKLTCSWKWCQRFDKVIEELEKKNLGSFKSRV